MRTTRDWLRICRFATVTLAVALYVLGRPGTHAEAGSQGDGPAKGAVLTIPYLANAMDTDSLDFSAAECIVAPSGVEMTCAFRQLFITPVSIDPSTCAVTTSGYSRTFRKETPTRWVSAEPPAGPCGLVERTTLEDGGTTRWTMTIRTAPRDSNASAECTASAPPPETYDWRHIKRKLPCANIQPGAIER